VATRKATPKITYAYCIGDVLATEIMWKLVEERIIILTPGRHRNPEGNEHGKKLLTKGFRSM
jgi:hypothetical protein